MTTTASDRSSLSLVISRADQCARYFESISVKAASPIYSDAHISTKDPARRLEGSVKAYTHAEQVPSGAELNRLLSCSGP